jgi:hypothetical protein
MIVNIINQLGLAGVIKSPLEGQPAAMTPILLGLLLLPCLLLAVVFLQPWSEPKWMFLDTITAAQYAPSCCHVYYGFVSNIGLLLWSGTAAACLVIGMAFFAAAKSQAITRFALSAGILTGWLALDDMFLVHEKVLPALGVPQPLVIATYMLLALVYAAASWRFIFQQEWWILALGSSALALSIFVDLVFHSPLPAFVYLEDSAKFFGIFCWCLFHLLALFTCLKNHLQLQKQG